jgi:hypothetical protein
MKWRRARSIGPARRFPPLQPAARYLGINLQNKYLNRGGRDGGIYLASSGVEFALATYLSRRISDGCAQEIEDSGRAEWEGEGEGREQRRHGKPNDSERAGSERKRRHWRAQRRDDSGPRLRGLSRTRHYGRRRVIRLVDRRTRDYGENRSSRLNAEAAPDASATSICLVNQLSLRAARELERCARSIRINATSEWLQWRA